MRKVEWVVYAKRPFGGPQQALDYLGRYTHRVAIANTRLIGLAGGQVRFRWKDYRHPQRPKIMVLPAGEFIRRLLDLPEPGRAPEPAELPQALCPALRPIARYLPHLRRT